MQLQGIGAVVTGGASGLGGAAAARLAAAGAKVTIFDLNVERGKAHAAAIGGTFAQVEVSDETAVDDALASAEQRDGPLRVLVNCAGLGAPARIIGRDGQALPLADFSRIITVNLLGTFNVLSRFAARLHRAEPIGEERGVIVNTASVAAFDGQIGQAAYSASKGGIVGMTLPIARELARYGIRTMAVAPGIFMTPAFDTLSQEVRDSLGAQVPFPNRMGQPEEFAALVEHIVLNPMLNGEVIRLDGAIRMGAK